MPDFRDDILCRLNKRNQQETDSYFQLVKSYTRLFERNNALKFELAEIKIANQRLFQENIEYQKSPGGSGGSSSSQGASNSYSIDKLRQLDEQLLNAKDQVIDLQKKLVEQSQQVINLSKQLKDKNDELSAKEARLVDAENRIELLKRLNQDLDGKIAAYEETFRLWKDEKLESEIKYNVLFQQYDKTKKDYNDLLTVQLQMKQDQVERMNKHNELENDRLQHRLRQEIERASQPTASDPIVNVNTSNLIPVGPVNQQYRNQVFNIPLVNKAIYKFDCNDGEVNCVKYHKNGKFFATGGGDRKIKLWEFKDGKCDLMGSLIGSNASIVSIDIDNESNLIAGTSFDFACRLWSLNEHRLRMSSGDIQPNHTLTGHTGKVLAGKFLSSMKIVTGSHDRTLKVWDLVQKACVKTLFAGSSCNDLVTMDPQLIISGHFDKKIRFWDARIDPTQSEISLQGKITSLDISSDRNCLLASIKDVNALKMIDIRMNQVVETFCSDDFKPAYDWSRAIFSPDIDHQYACAGSADGSVIIWNCQTAKVEKTLKEHNSSVLSLAWHPQGHFLLSCDSKKKCVFWSNA